MSASFFSGVSNSIRKNLEEKKISCINDVLLCGKIQVVELSTIVPLLVGETTLGVMYLDRPTIQKENLDIIQLFANQAAVAIQNVQLYEMAAIDSLTGVYGRGFFEQVVLRELRTAFRSQHECSMLLVDVDDMKAINDGHGHLVGDDALATIGKVLKQATRGNDAVGRVGGDEFAIFLPQTPTEGAMRVGNRIFDMMKDQYIVGSSSNIPLNVSIGTCELERSTISKDEIIRPVTREYFIKIYEKIVKSADEALYRAKDGGGNQVSEGNLVSWR